MTPSQLRNLHEQHHPESLFFSRDTMRFFGDTMHNYGVRLARHERTTISNDDFQVTGVIKTPAWELYRKHPVKHGVRSSAYFSRETFKVLGNDAL